jgi:hypothetical protein
MLDRESGKTRSLRTNCPRRPTKGSIAMTSRAQEDGDGRPVAAEVRHRYPLRWLCGRGQEISDDIGSPAAGRRLGRHRVHGSQWTNSVRSMFRRCIPTPTNFVRCPQERKPLLGAHATATGSPMPAEHHPSRGRRRRPSSRGGGRTPGSTRARRPESLDERLAWLTHAQPVDGRATLSHPRHDDHSSREPATLFRGKAGVGAGLHQGPGLPAQC